MTEQMVDRLLDEGFALADKGSFEAALGLFEQVVEIDESNAEAWMMRGAIKGELGIFQEALACLDRAVLLDAEYANSHYLRSKVLLSLGQVDEAEASGRKAVELEPAFGEAWLALSGIYSQNRQIEEAEVCCRHAVECLPDSTDAKSILAYLLKLRGECAQAILLYQEILLRDPANAQINYNIGTAFQEQGKMGEAERHYSQAIKLDPGFADAYSALGDVFLVQKTNIAGALENCRKAVEINPLSAELQNRLELALTASGSPEKRQLLDSLEEDHIYSDMQEPLSIAKNLSVLYPNEYEEVRGVLIRLFSEFNPGEIYSAQWWRAALDLFGAREKAYDKVARGVLSSVYCWSIPSKETLDEIKKFSGDSRLASYGSGRSYWEYLLNVHYGVDISASDLFLRNRFVEIQQQSYADAGVSSADTVFLSWVPKGETGAESIVEKMQSAQKLVLVGEPPDHNGTARACGTNRFFAILRDQFLHISTVPVVQFSYHSDAVELYKKR